ncbi:spermatogenesis-associated protein 13 [Diaphorina citri]|uniref:Spermatogenesis-associated protein 13 n=1 Tax=Diaphorina citri TaxID=121845 RepID=A0A3Q0JFL6_DIACI|nr:spermatogenesis-associated protein 13 [Diaphorina citri]
MEYSVWKKLEPFHNSDVFAFQVRRRGIVSSGSEGKPSRPTSDVISQVLIDKLKVSPIKHLFSKRIRPHHALRRSVSQPLGINELSPLLRRKPIGSRTSNTLSDEDNTKTSGGPPGTRPGDGTNSLCCSDDELLSDSESSVTSLGDRKRCGHGMDEDFVVLAEAVWDHVAMEAEELGFRAGDVIEVLDTLDRDWWWGTRGEASGWFPSAFVRLRVSQEDTVEDCLAALASGGSKTLRRRTSISLLSNDQVRSRVVRELINTERDFVKVLHDVSEGYLAECRRRNDMFSPEQIQTIFGNLEDILAFQSSFLEDLETKLDWDAPYKSCIGETFLKHKSGFRMYSEGYPHLGVTVRHAIKIHCSDKDKWLLFCCRSLEDKARWLAAFQQERALVEQDREDGLEFAPAAKELARMSAARCHSSRPPVVKHRSKRTSSGSTTPNGLAPRSHSLGRRVGTWFNFGANKKNRTFNRAATMQTSCPDDDSRSVVFLETGFQEMEDVLKVAGCWDTKTPRYGVRRQHNSGVMLLGQRIMLLDTLVWLHVECSYTIVPCDTLILAIRIISANVHTLTDAAQSMDIAIEYLRSPRFPDTEKLYQHNNYSKFFEACRLMRGLIEIPLDGYLLTPVQRICKYPLQLAELLKYTKTDHPDYVKITEALEAMRDVAMLINERKRRMESLEKLAAWQQRVEGWEGEDLIETSSQLIHQGEVIRVTSGMWTNTITLFLFDHQLVYCKRDILKRNTHVYKARLNIDTSQIINLPDGKDPHLGVTVRHAIKIHCSDKDKWLLFCCRSLEDKARWLAAFQQERALVEQDREDGLEFAPAAKELARMSAARCHSSRPPVVKHRSKRTSSGSTTPNGLAPRSHSLGRRVGTWFNFGANKKNRTFNRAATMQTVVHPS